MPKPKKTQKGRFRKIFLDSSDGAETATFVELKMVGNGSWSQKPRMASVEVRGDGRGTPQESFAVDQEATFTLKVPEDVSELGVYNYYYEMQEASQSGEALKFCLASGPIATVGTRKLTGWYEISNFEEDEPLDGFVEISVTIVPTRAGDFSAPVFTTVAAP